MPIQFTDDQLSIISDALYSAHLQLHIYDGDDYEELYGERVRSFEKMMKKIDKYYIGRAKAKKPSKK